jgi:hypothetical protein
MKETRVDPVAPTSDNMTLKSVMEMLIANVRLRKRIYNTKKSPYYKHIEE